MVFPDATFLTLKDLARFLDMDERVLRALIEAGVIPKGVVRQGERRPVWDRNRAAVAHWISANPDAFEKTVSTPGIAGNSGELQEIAAKSRTLENSD